MKMLTILLSLFFAISSFANLAPTEINLTSEIKRVTVFRKGAQVTREATASIPSGNTLLKFTGISPQIDKNSIQVKGEGNFTILSVNHQLNYFEEPTKNQSILDLEKEQFRLSEKSKEAQALLFVLKEEESLLLTNKSLAGSQTGMQIETLKATAEFYRTRLKAIKLEQLAVGRSMFSDKDSLQRVNAQLNELNAQQGVRTSEIVLAVNSTLSSTADFTLSYIVYNAGWFPNYDIRVKDVESPINLSYKGNVYQTSGEEWKDVKLTLSTGDFTQNGNIPEVLPWRLDFYERYTQNRYDKKKNQLLGKDEDGIEVRGSRSNATDVYVDGVRVGESQVLEVTKTERSTTVEFEIETPYNIPSDGKQYTVKMKDHELPAYYEYYCAPRLDPDAFLTAQVTGWEEFNLLSGEANLFFEGTFLGKSILDVQVVTDTLDISLGRDKGIVVERTKQKDYTKKQFIGNKKTDHRSWNIEVRNKKKQRVNIVIEDQFPIASNSDIEVEKIDYYDAALDEDTGILTWRMNLAKNESQKVNFKYTVKYPKRKSVVLD